MPEAATLTKDVVRPVDVPKAAQQHEADRPVDAGAKKMGDRLDDRLQTDRDSDELARFIAGGGEDGAKKRAAFLPNDGETDDQWTKRLADQARAGEPQPVAAGATQTTDADSFETAGQKKEQAAEATAAQMAVSEKGYIDDHKAKWTKLEGQYVDERSNYPFVKQQIADFAKASGLQQEVVAELTDRAFDAETRQVILERVQVHVDRLFNSEQGRLNPEKHKVVADETRRYIELVSLAQAEGDIPRDLAAQAVLDLAVQNTWTLAFQDRVASENLLGDHGVRHLVAHNIRAIELIDDELVRNGQPVPAIDRLITHQVMIDHDLGYAMDPIRDPINKGEFADKGHNVLAAKYERQRAGDRADALGHVFSQGQIAQIHEGILDHDGSSVNFHVGETNDEARRDNINSAIHVADNTHAFEDKLPELLYVYPDTIRVMRLMKTAGEIGDTVTLQSLQSQLVDDIQSNRDFSADDKVALVQAARSVTSESYKFSVGRICGNKPEYAMDAQGVLAVSVQESAIHQDVVGLYGQESYDQLRKFVGGLTGKDGKEVDLNSDTIRSANGRLEIKIRIGEQRADAAEKTDYQKRLDELVKDPSFQEFIIGNGADNPGDADLSVKQANLAKQLTNPAIDSDMRTNITARISEITQQRRENLQRYLAK